MRLQTIPRIPRPVIVAPPAVQQNRLLWCETEGTLTPHALTQAEDAYVCGCGTAIRYFRVIAKPMYAIDLSGM